MPRYYCDYCDTYLTHDSPSVRKQHNAGYKHKANVRSYYQQFEEQQTQSLIDQKVKEHLGQAAIQQVGAAFHQHMTVMQSGPFRPPVVLPVPGVSASPIRLPALPRPPATGPIPGYGMLPGVQLPVESNGLPGAPSLTPPGPPGLRPPAASFPLPNGSVPPLQPPSGSFGSFPSVMNASYSQQSAALSAMPTQYSPQQAARPMAPSGPPGESPSAHGSSSGPPGANQATYSFPGAGGTPPSFES